MISHQSFFIENMIMVINFYIFAKKAIISNNYIFHSNN